MRIMTEILLAIIVGVFTLGFGSNIAYEKLKALHDAVRKEALTTISRGLTPMSETVKRFRGGELEDSWLKPVPDEELNSAMRGVGPMIPPKH